TIFSRDWSSDVCSSDLFRAGGGGGDQRAGRRADERYPCLGRIPREPGEGDGQEGSGEGDRLTEASRGSRSWPLSRCREEAATDGGRVCQRSLAAPFLRAWTPVNQSAYMRLRQVG